MSLNTESESPTTGGICERMQDLISVLTESSIQMRDALIHRRVNEIWQIMAEKQQKVAELEQYIQLWHRMYGDMELKPDSSIGKERLRIRESLTSLKEIEHNNAILSKSFLSAINRAFNRAGVGGSSPRGTYTKRGKYNKDNRSMIVKQYG